jgi:hypothetical protein
VTSSASTPIPPTAEPAGWIISASRRTDLPGYHADECAGRLLRLRRPVHSVFFWTRYPAALVRPGPLAEVLRALPNPFVHLTLTGLGGTALEPRVPPTREALAALDPLITALRGQPERVLWRFDPVLREWMSLESFTLLAGELAARGIRTCIFSFPSALSLKGPLDLQYQRFGIQRWPRAEKRERALRMAEVAARHGLSLEICNQPQVVADCAGAVKPAACISAERAQRFHPRAVPLALPKDPGQRRNCNCSLSHDIGRYQDRCRSGCAYCYSSAGGPDASDDG